MTSIKINKIKKSEYEKLKEIYLTKNRHLRSLYTDFNKENQIKKRTFFALINKIRIEEGYPPVSRAKKTKRKNNEFSYLDKHPNSYKGKSFLN